METNRVVTVAEQEAMGILRPRQNFVPATVDSRPARAEIVPAQVTAMQHSTHAIDVPLSATQHIEMRTSATDRAWGFLIASLPRTFAFSLAVVIAGIVLGGWTLATSITILFVVFSIVELASYVFTLAISAEGVSYYEAKQKWRVIRDEQRARWAHYNKLGGQ